jgi:muramoyltetrapeptide carboxypeptidase
MAATQVRFPPSLKKGDTIGIVCPAGYMPIEKVSECIRVLSSEWGYAVKVGRTVGNSFHYFSGTDDERTQDLQQMLDDPDVHAILFGRGGYGLGRIIDRLDFTRFRRHPKWLIGFSDITVIHCHVFSRFGIATLHAPMANAFNDDGYKGPSVRSLYEALKGRRSRYVSAPHAFDRRGRATGRLVGGNLSLLAHGCGTTSDIHPKGCILFLEDLGEYLYNVDRMMYQLKRSGKLDGLAGLILGGFTDMKDTEPPFGQDIWSILRDVTAEYGYPVCFGFPVSHGKENYALKVGATHTLSVRRAGTTLKEV